MGVNLVGWREVRRVGVLAVESPNHLGTEGRMKTYTYQKAGGEVDNACPAPSSPSAS
jgi:hypothetical protein